MPAKQIYVQQNTEVCKELKNVFTDEKASKVILLLEGSTDINTGDSWDASCCKAEALLEPYLNAAPESTIFMMVEVGSNEAWQDCSNFFKTHTVFKLTAIPTVLVLTSPETVAKRLEGTACLDANALSELFK